MSFFHAFKLFEASYRPPAALNGADCDN